MAWGCRSNPSNFQTWPMAGMNAIKWNVASSSPDICFWERFEVASSFNDRSEFRMSIFLGCVRSIGISHENFYVLGGVKMIISVPRE